MNGPSCQGLEGSAANDTHLAEYIGPVRRCGNPRVPRARAASASPSIVWLRSGMTFGACRASEAGDILDYNTNKAAPMPCHAALRSAVRPLHRWPWLTLPLAMALALGACQGRPGTAEAGGKPGAAAKAAEAVPVEVARAERRPIAASYAGTAPLEAQAEAQVVAKTSGIALQVLADVGDRVRAGQPLVRIDRDRAALQAAQAEAQLRKLEANYRRATQLAAQQLVSANDLDQLKFDLENARAAYRLATLELSYGTVTAPIAGVVASRSIKPGNLVQINTPIMTIVDTSRLQATLNVPERELEVLRPGQAVQLQVDALPGRSFAGRIERVAPVVDAGSGTFRVVVGVDGEGELQPGMFGRIRIEYDRRADALVIPRSALLDDGGTPAVYVVEGGKARRVELQTGYIDGPWVEVRRGLAPGAQVVVAGKSALRDGSPVQVIGTSAARAQGAP